MAVPWSASPATTITDDEGTKGFNIISAPGWDSPAYGKIADLMKKHGMNAKVLFSNGCPWPYADKGNPERQSRG